MCYEILDIGCGGSPRGDINCDSFLNKTPHTLSYINPRKAPNFINCDAQYLPFRDNSIRIVMSSHVLEHLENPTKCLNEISRITKDYFIIKVPNMWYWKRLLLWTTKDINIEHKQGWDFLLLLTIAKKMKLKGILFDKDTLLKHSIIGKGGLKSYIFLVLSKYRIVYFLVSELFITFYKKAQTK